MSSQASIKSSRISPSTISNSSKTALTRRSKSENTEDISVSDWDKIESDLKCSIEEMSLKPFESTASERFCETIGASQDKDSFFEAFDDFITPSRSTNVVSLQTHTTSLVHFPSQQPMPTVGKHPTGKNGQKGYVEKPSEVKKTDTTEEGEVSVASPNAVDADMTAIGIVTSSVSTRSTATTTCVAADGEKAVVSRAVSVTATPEVITPVCAHESVSVKSVVLGKPLQVMTLDAPHINASTVTMTGSGRTAAEYSDTASEKSRSYGRVSMGGDSVVGMEIEIPTTHTRLGEVNDEMCAEEGTQSAGPALSSSVYIGTIAPDSPMDCDVPNTHMACDSWESLRKESDSVVHNVATVAKENGAEVNSIDDMSKGKVECVGSQASKAGHECVPIAKTGVAESVRTEDVGVQDHQMGKYKYAGYDTRGVHNTQHTLSEKGNNTQHTLSEKGNKTQHTLSEKDDNTQHTLSEKDDNTQHTLSEKDDNTQHTLSEKDDYTQHTLSEKATSVPQTTGQSTGDAVSSQADTMSCVAGNGSVTGEGRGNDSVCDSMGGISGEFNYGKLFSKTQTFVLVKAMSRRKQKESKYATVSSGKDPYDKRQTLAQMFSASLEQKERQRTLAQRRKTCNRIQVDLAELFDSPSIKRRTVRSKTDNTAAKKITSHYANTYTTMSKTRAATVMQACWRGRQTRLMYKKIVRRGYAMHELLDTEVSYVRLLRMLQLWYIKPLTSAANKNQEYLNPVISLDEVNRIFSNAQDLYYCHRDLLCSMQERFDKWHHEQLLGDLFLPMADIHMSAYIQYVNEYDRSVETYNVVKMQPAMKAFLEERRQTKGIKEDLSDLLISPVQRIPRYSMLLEQILKYTPKSHPDFVNLTNALATIKRVADTINERKRAKQLVEQLATKVTGCPEPIAISSRYLITVCDMLDVDKAKLRRLFLCNDCILITTATSPRNLFGGSKQSSMAGQNVDKTTFQFSQILYLEITQAEFIEASSNAVRAKKTSKQFLTFKDANWSIRFTQPTDNAHLSKVWEFMVPSDGVKDLWQKKIYSLGEEEVKDDRRRKNIERMKEIVNGASCRLSTDDRRKHGDRETHRQDSTTSPAKMLQLVTDPELLADDATRAEGLKALETKRQEIEMEMAVEKNIKDGIESILTISQFKDVRSKKVEREISALEKKIRQSNNRLDLLGTELDNHNQSIKAIRSTQYDTKLDGVRETVGAEGSAFPSKTNTGNGSDSPDTQSDTRVGAHTGVREGEAHSEDTEGGNKGGRDISEESCCSAQSSSNTHSTSQPRSTTEITSDSSQISTTSQCDGHTGNEIEDTARASRHRGRSENEVQGAETGANSGTDQCVQEMNATSVHSNGVRTRSNLATAHSPTVVEDVGMGETPNKEGCGLPYMEGGSISEQADVHVSPRHSNTSIVRSCDETIGEVDDEEALSGKEHTNTIDELALSEKKHTNTTDELALSGKEHTNTMDTWVRRGSLPTHIATTEKSCASTQSPETKTDSHTAKVAVNKSMPDLLDRLESQPNKKAIKKRTPSMRNILRSFPTFGMGLRKGSHTGSTYKASDLSLQLFGHKHSACDRVTSFTGDIAEHDSTTRNPLSRICTHSTTHTKHSQPTKDADAEMDIAITESTNANTCMAYGMA